MFYLFIFLYMFDFPRILFTHRREWGKGSEKQGRRTRNNNNNNNDLNYLIRMIPFISEEVGCQVNVSLFLFLFSRWSVRKCVMNVTLFSFASSPLFKIKKIKVLRKNETLRYYRWFRSSSSGMNTVWTSNKTNFWLISRWPSMNDGDSLAI